MPPSRTKSNRTNDLKQALTCGLKINGNHRTEVITRTPPPLEEACPVCPLRLVCTSVGPERNRHPGRHCQTVITAKFFYHGTCCLTFDERERTLDDHGYWGYSITTSRAIRWYVQALWDNDLLYDVKDVERSLLYFRKRKNTKDGPFKLDQQRSIS